MLFEWVQNYRLPDPYLEEEERRTCPLIWCRNFFDSKESVVRHVFECPRLSNAWYWCPYHEHPERFLDCDRLWESIPKFKYRVHLEKIEELMARWMTGRPRQPYGQISSLCQSQVSLSLARQLLSSINSRGSERSSRVSGLTNSKAPKHQENGATGVGSEEQSLGREECLESKAKLGTDLDGQKFESPGLDSGSLWAHDTARQRLLCEEEHQHRDAAPADQEWHRGSAYSSSSWCGTSSR